MVQRKTAFPVHKRQVSLGSLTPARSARISMAGWQLNQNGEVPLPTRKTLKLPPVEVRVWHGSDLLSRDPRKQLLERPGRGSWMPVLTGEKGGCFEEGCQHGAWVLIGPQTPQGGYTPLRCSGILSHTCCQNAELYSGECGGTDLGGELSCCLPCQHPILKHHFESWLLHF